MKCLECGKDELDLGQLETDGEENFMKYTCLNCGATYAEYSETRIFFEDSQGLQMRWLTQTEIQKAKFKPEKVQFDKLKPNLT